MELYKLISKYIKYIPKNKNLDNYIDAILNGYRKAGWSASTYSKYNKLNFPKKGKESILNYILNIENIGYCTKCKNLKDTKDFHSNISKFNNLADWCKTCTRIYMQENSTNYVKNSANYKARKLAAIPKDEDMEKIAKFYHNCPKGYHVDHIIPLSKGGLHTLSNLQYLTAEENLKKGTKIRV